jgi:hypothetical protein
VQRETELELEALRSSVVWVQDLVVGNVDGSSLQATSMSAVAEQLKGQIDAALTNGVRWGSRFALVATTSHFLELDADIVVLRFRRNEGLTEDEVDALWSWVRVVADSLVSHVPSSVAHNPPASTRK